MSSDPSVERWLLVDGSSYLYRAFHAMADLRGPQGEPTGAVHGMVNMLERLRKDYLDVTHAVCVFDAKGTNFRNDWYPQYKANRPPMPDDLRLQIEPIHEVVKLMGWPILEVPGIEADDAIGTLASAVANRGKEVIISTGDKDMAQLVSRQVSLVNTMSNEHLDEAGVIAKFGVPAERIVDYLSLMGDVVDNVPGVEKVGPKTAAKWIQEHGSLDGVIAAANSIKGVVGENLRQALDWLPQAKRLVTIRCDCDLKAQIPDWPSIDALRLCPPDEHGLLAFYSTHGFKSAYRELQKRLMKADDLLSQLSANKEHDDVAVPDDKTLLYETILTWAAFDALMFKLMASPLTAFDTETDSLDPMMARLVGISVSTNVGTAAYIPLRHEGPDAPAQLPIDDVLKRMRPWLESPDFAKVGQNIKYDIHVLANMGIDVRGYAHDTMLQSYVLEAHKPHSLENLAMRHLNRRGLSYEQVAGKGVGQISFAQVPVDIASQYSCEDSDMTLHLHEVLWPKLQANAGMLDVYQRIEMPAAWSLQRIERHGVLIDKALLQQQSRELAERILVIEQLAYTSAGQPFNLGSPKQIGEILFVNLGLPVIKKTATGVPSTDEEVLEKLAQDYPLPKLILEHRSLSKLKSTYCDKLAQMINPVTGRVHTNYAQAVAVTGRLSSNEPNLQNIPVRSAEGRRIREAFIAPAQHVIVSADYSQIELRIMAHLSQDEGLMFAFSQGLDIHRATASEVFGVAVDQVSHEQRRYAKVINFGLIYGMSAFGLAANLGIERSAAHAYIERYFQRYPGVRTYMDSTKAKAKAQGYVETVFGRRLWLPEINSPNGPRRAGAERAAINAPMQGTAADLIKLAMVAVQNAIDAQSKASRMIMQVHDELVFEVPDSEIEWVRTAVPHLMAEVAQLHVPLLAEVGVGANWELAH